MKMWLCLFLEQCEESIAHALGRNDSDVLCLDEDCHIGLRDGQKEL